MSADRAERHKSFARLAQLGNLLLPSVVNAKFIAKDLEAAFAAKQNPQAALDDAVKRGNGLLRQFERHTQQ